MIARQPEDIEPQQESSDAYYPEGEQLGGFLGQSYTPPCVRRDPAEFGPRPPRPCGLPYLGRLALGAALLLACLMAPCALWGQQGRTVGDCVGEITRTTIWVGQPVSARVFGAFTPSARWRPFLDGNAAYEARYGIGSARQKGNTVGERYNAAIVAAVLLGPDNPCGLPVGYDLSRVDAEDLKMAAIGRASFYDAWIIPRYARQQDAGKPPPAECPSCPSCPSCPPAVEAPSVCARARVRYSPGVASTGRLTLEIVGQEPCPEGVR